MLRSNGSLTSSNNSLWFWKMTVNETREVHQSKTSGEETTSEFQGQHAAQFNFCRYENVCATTDVFHGILRKSCKK